MCVSSFKKLLIIPTWQAPLQQGEPRILQKKKKKKKKKSKRDPEHFYLIRRELSGFFMFSWGARVCGDHFLWGPHPSACDVRHNFKQNGKSVEMFN